MKIVFMGTPEFSVAPLQSLVDSGYDICGVYTKPPTQTGRGKKITKSQLHQKADELKIKVFTPKTLKNSEIQQELFELSPDLIVVVAYGLFLPKSILDFCPCFNIHASLLPKYRGAAPIQRAILNGEKESGITIMRMDEGMDTGDMVIKEEISITDKTDAGILHDQLKEIGAKLIVKTIKDFENNNLTFEKQNNQDATYADKIKSEEEKINWNQDAEQIFRHIKAFNPYPSVYFEYNGQKIKIIDAQFDIDFASKSPAGTIIDQRLSIATNKGIIKPTILQRQGKHKLKINDFLNGFKFNIGDVL